jgi:hypothetical protein
VKKKSVEKSFSMAQTFSLGYVQTWSRGEDQCRCGLFKIQHGFFANWRDDIRRASQQKYQKVPNIEFRRKSLETYVWMRLVKWERGETFWSVVGIPGYGAGSGKW